LEGLRPSEIVAVGDSVEHDVRGANGMEIDCCFVTSGIHADELPAGLSDRQFVGAVQLGPDPHG